MRPALLIITLFILSCSSTPKPPEDIPIEAPGKIWKGYEKKKHLECSDKVPSVVWFWFDKEYFEARSYCKIHYKLKNPDED